MVLPNFPALTLLEFFSLTFPFSITEDLTGLVLTTACIISGLLAASSGVLFCFLYFHHFNDQVSFSVVVGVIGFFLGYTFTGLFMEIVDAGVATLFVCFVYEPERLRESSPIFYEKVCLPSLSS
jgi:membrane associated rhomboid family serine protease